MYIKKILLAIAVIGLAVAAYFAYFIYGAMLKPNTAFNNEEAYIYVPTNSKYETVRDYSQMDRSYNFGIRRSY